MKKIVILNGAGKKNGNTAAMNDAEESRRIGSSIQ